MASPSNDKTIKVSAPQPQSRRTLKNYFKTGRIYLKSGTEDVYVYEINCRRTIREKVFPFMERYVIPLGCKFRDDATGPGTFSLVKELLNLFDQKKRRPFR